MSNENSPSLFFSDELVALYVSICEEDEVAVATLTYLGANFRDEVPHTIARLAREITMTRKVGQLNRQKKVIGYEYQEGVAIGRSRAERVTEKLIFAGLVEVVNNPPSKILRLSPRGKQVTMELQRKKAKEA